MEKYSTASSALTRGCLESVDVNLLEQVPIISHTLKVIMS